MASATAHPNHQLISSEDVEGTNVYDMKGTKIGDIDHLMIDKISGQVNYDILSFGGFLGIGSEYYPLPWRNLTYDTSLGGFRVDVARETLEGAPKYGRDTAWSDWAMVDAYYGPGT